MIDSQLASQLQPSLCTAIASLIEDEHEAIVTAHPSDSYGRLAIRLQQVGADIIALAAAMEAVARWSVEGDEAAGSLTDR